MPEIETLEPFGKEADKCDETGLSSVINWLYWFIVRPATGLVMVEAAVAITLVGVTCA
ncbi:putative D-alanine-D-alanine ligase [Corchorus olitorius]|uniref:D-alanine-D-alanine ligase n=1 Tax=Corchorus olitorius TaxID=93759 RepID=A0A1R3GSH4_9ROSI|nr:putative D-alanine-D-alanine ligase [Corchorus olitorius]